MNINKINPFIEWVKINDIDYLYFKFTGIFTLKQATRAIEYWKKQHDLKKDLKVSLVWDCLAMENYESEARKVWRLTITELSGLIQDIWVISNSVIILAGVEIISFFTKYDINVVKTKEELYEKLNN